MKIVVYKEILCNDIAKRYDEHLEVGRRYSFVATSEAENIDVNYLTLDTDSKAVCRYIKAYIESRKGIELVEGGVIFGSISEDGIFKTKDENGAIEVSTIPDFEEQVKKGNHLLRDYLRKRYDIANNFDLYRDKLKLILNSKGIDWRSDKTIFSKEEISIDVKDIAGRDSWIDGNTLNEEKYYCINEAMEEFNSEFKGKVKCIGYIVDKTCFRFQFVVDINN